MDHNQRTSSRKQHKEKDDDTYSWRNPSYKKKFFKQLKYLVDDDDDDNTNNSRNNRNNNNNRNRNYNSSADEGYNTNFEH